MPEESGLLWLIWAGTATLLLDFNWSTPVLSLLTFVCFISSVFAFSMMSLPSSVRLCCRANNNLSVASFNFSFIWFSFQSFLVVRAVPASAHLTPHRPWDVCFNSIYSCFIQFSCIYITSVTIRFRFFFQAAGNGRKNSPHLTRRNCEQDQAGMEGGGFSPASMNIQGVRVTQAASDRVVLHSDFLYNISTFFCYHLSLHELISSDWAFSNQHSQISKLLLEFPSFMYCLARLSAVCKLISPPVVMSLTNITHHMNISTWPEVMDWRLDETLSRTESRKKKVLIRFFICFIHCDLKT